MMLTCIECHLIPNGY